MMVQNDNVAIQKLVFRLKGRPDVRMVNRQERLNVRSNQDDREADAMLRAELASRCDFFYFEATEKTALNSLLDQRDV